MFLPLVKVVRRKTCLLIRTNLKKRNIAYYKINRGGDITYHGPGQLVVYPIFNLDYFFTDIHQYMRFLEEAVILMLAEYGIKGERLKGMTGVWLMLTIRQKPVKFAPWVCVPAIGLPCMA